jgi:transposase
VELDRRGARAIIPPKAGRGREISSDFEMYKWRPLVEKFFRDLNQFRRIATRHGLI